MTLPLARLVRACTAPALAALAACGSADEQPLAPESARAQSAELTAKVAELETQRAAEREENARLRAQNVQAREIIGWSLESLRLLALAVHPIVPAPMGELRAAVGMTGELDFAAESHFGVLPEGAVLAAPPNLFPRVSTEDLPQA